MKKLWHLAAYLVGGAVALWLTVKFFLPIGLPFLFGLGIARLAEPLILLLTKKAHFPRGLGAFVGVSLMLFVLSALIWLLGKTLLSELGRFARQLPDMASALEEPVGKLRQVLLNLTQRLPGPMAEAASQWLSGFFAGSSVLADSVSQWLLRFVTGTLATVPDGLLFLLTALLSAYLIAGETPALTATVRRFLPKSWRDRCRSLWKRLKQAIGGYVKAQLRLMALTFVLVFSGLLLLRREHALLFALGIAIVDALPVFGAGTVLVPWGVLAFLKGDSFTGVGLLVLYAVVSLSRTLLEPRFLGKQMGLDPLLTLLSLYAGYRLFGLPGMILLPVGVMLCKQLYDLLERQPPDSDIAPATGID